MGDLCFPAVLLFLAVRAVAGPTGAVDSHAVRATGFPGAFLGSVSLSVAEDPRYGSRLLDGMDLHLRSVSAMTVPSAVSDYLENSVMSTLGGGQEAASRLAASLGSEPLDSAKASALLIANALARPGQFREVLDGLETIKPGLGKHAARLLREAQGTGDKKLLRVLRAAGDKAPRGGMLTYGSGRRLDRVFDASTAPVEGAAPDSSAGAGLRSPSVRLD